MAGRDVDEDELLFPSTSHSIGKDLEHAHVADCAQCVESRPAAAGAARIAPGAEPATSGRRRWRKLAAASRRRTPQPARAIAKRCSLAGPLRPRPRLQSPPSVVQPTVQTLSHPFLCARRRVAHSSAPARLRPTASDAAGFGAAPRPASSVSVSDAPARSLRLVCRCDSFCWRTRRRTNPPIAHWWVPKQKPTRVSLANATAAATASKQYGSTPRPRPGPGPAWWRPRSHAVDNPLPSRIVPRERQPRPMSKHDAPPRPSSAATPSPPSRCAAAASALASKPLGSKLDTGATARPPSALPDEQSSLRQPDARRTATPTAAAHAACSGSRSTSAPDDEQPTRWAWGWTASAGGLASVRAVRSDALRIGATTLHSERAATSRWRGATCCVRGMGAAQLLMQDLAPPVPGRNREGRSSSSSA